jgi:hypothetical protein
MIWSGNEGEMHHVGIYFLQSVNDAVRVIAHHG